MGKDQEQYVSSSEASVAGVHSMQHLGFSLTETPDYVETGSSFEAEIKSSFNDQGVRPSSLQ